MTAYFQPWLGHIPAWLLVMFRLTGIFFVAPVFSSRLMPPQVKVFMVVTLSFCVYPMLLTRSVGSPAVMHTMEHGLTLWMLIPQIATELLIGAVLGYGASLPLMAMQVGGHVIDQQMGMGIAGVFNPELGAQTGVVGEFYYLLAVTLFVLMGGMQVMLITLAGTFEHIPLGGFYVDSQLITLLLGMLNAMMSLALRIAAPLLCLIFLETVAMGFLMRTVPQINVLSIGFPVRILIGVGVLVGTVAIVMDVFSEQMRMTLHRLGVFFGL